MYSHQSLLVDCHIPYYIYLVAWRSLTADPANKLFFTIFRFIPVDRGWVSLFQDSLILQYTRIVVLKFVQLRAFPQKDILVGSFSPLLRVWHYLDTATKRTNRQQRSVSLLLDSPV